MSVARRRIWILGLFCLFLVPLLSLTSEGAESEEPFREVVGIYVHQHWPYEHPYSARTWTMSDWEGYLDGLRQLGYNTVLVWPILETMPEPLTVSDQANLDKISRVIDMAHQRFGMRVYLVVCPNVAAKNDVASRYTFEERPYFYSDYRVDPGDPAALAEMLAWRKELLRPLRHADGIMIIDSDPGGYPGSGNIEFVYLLGAYRRMLSELRPGIELYYWIHAGWPAYGRFYETGVFRFGTDEEFLLALTMLGELNPEPWGLANGLDHAEELGMASRVINFNYGAIEGEPSFPMTNFGGDRAWEAGGREAPRGVMGNAQTHCVQLPNTFAFARGAQGLTVSRSDYVEFAGRLISGHGEQVVEGWEALNETDSGKMRGVAASLENLLRTDPEAGSLEGLLFGSPRRFLGDLVMQLRLKAALEDFRVSVLEDEKGLPVVEAFRDFVEAAETWQHQHGYACRLDWPRLEQALQELKIPILNQLLDEDPHLGAGATPFEQVMHAHRRRESQTLRLMKSLNSALLQLEKKR